MPFLGDLACVSILCRQLALDLKALWSAYCEYMKIELSEAWRTKFQFLEHPDLAGQIKAEWRKCHTISYSNTTAI